MSLAGVPAGLREPWVRFIPLKRGTKVAMVSGASWQAGATWEEETDRFLTRERFYPRGDVGVRLEVSGPGLLVLDGDVVLEQRWTPTGLASVVVADGRYELARLLCLGGPTLVLESPGREDGTHGRGWHAYYRLAATISQRSRWWLHSQALSAGLDLKVSGICRLTREMTVLRDLPVAEANETLLAALRTAVNATHTDRTSGGQGRAGSGPVPVETYLALGIARGSQHNELLRLANALFARGEPASVVRDALWAVLERSEQDPRWPWGTDDVERLVQDAARWVAAQRAAELDEVDALRRLLRWT